AFWPGNAAPVGEPALVCPDLAELLRAAVAAAALSHCAVRASTEPYAAAVHEARRHPGQRAVAASLRVLLEPAAEQRSGPGPASRIQDPYGYRALPQVHGPVVDAVGQAERAGGAALCSARHTGTFPPGSGGLARAAVGAGVLPAPWLGAPRLGTLVEPAFTGLAPFLATDPPPSSGIMILEYVAHSAIADIRRLA